MKNIVIGILVFILGVAAGQILDTTTLLSNFRIPYLTATPTPFASPTPAAEAGDPTANWRTYTNEQLGVSIQYPPDLIIVTDKDRRVLRPVPYTGHSIQIADTTEPSKTTRSIQINIENTLTYEVPWSGGKIIILTKDNLDVFHMAGKIPSTEISGRYALKTQTVGNGLHTIVSILDGTRVLQIKIDSKDESFMALHDQILSTFKFIEQSPATSPTSTVPPNWIRHTFNTYGLTMYTPDDWQSDITDYPADSNSLIKFWKKSSPTIIPIQIPIKSSWDNTGNAQSQPKNFTVGGSIPAYRMDPPTRTQQTLDRYQTNVYFEHNSKVYVFECVHNWTQDYLDTCNTMLETLQFTK